MDCFNGIVGQAQALLQLQKALETGRINHAYLFVGPAGVGKFTMAELFAQAIILEADSQGEVFLKAGIHPDFMIIEKDQSKTMIGIEKINRVIEPWLSLKPYRAGYRVVIIKDAHLLSLPAANALLKTLEEPPGHAVIILVSDEQNLLETIISRCQLVRFFPLEELDIRDFLLRRGIEAEQAARMARLGQGSIASAVLWAGEASLQELMDKAQGFMKDLSSGNEVEVFNCAEQMEKSPAMMSNLLYILLRDIYIFQATGREDLLVMEGNLEWLQSFKQLDPNRVQSALAGMDALRKQFRGPVSSLLLSINFSYQLLDALK